MILKPLEFEWKIDGDSHVHFTVRQNPAHAIHEKYYSKGKIPPISERVNYYRHIGTVSEKSLKNMVKNHKSYVKNSEKNQEALDAVFSKFNVKPKKKKVLKPVKKN